MDAVLTGRLNRFHAVSRRLKWLAVIGAAGMATTAGVWPVAVWSAPGLVPHMAAYSMQVSPAGNGLGVLGGRGVMQLEWRRDCDGVTYSQQSLLTLNSEDGGVFDSSVRIESWEAADAGTFRFMLESSIEDHVTEEVNGLAERREDGSVDVSYTKPLEEQRRMPPETVFPWQQMRMVLENASTGVRHSWFRLLRGEAEGDPVGVSVQIAGAEGPPADAGDLGLRESASELLPAEGWRVVSAYFEDRVKAEPDFEISETVLASGVITRATIAYPDMTMRLTLQRLQPVPMPDCGG